jgi:cytochrome b561
MTYAESMILGYTVLVGVTLGSLLVIRLLWKTNEQTLSQVVQTERRS